MSSGGVRDKLQQMPHKLQGIYEFMEKRARGFGDVQVLYRKEHIAFKARHNFAEIYPQIGRFQVDVHPAGTDILPGRTGQVYSVPVKRYSDPAISLAIAFYINESTNLSDVEKILRASYSSRK